MKISNDESVRASRIEPVVPAQSGAIKTQGSATGHGPAAQIELSEQAKALSASKAEAARYLPAVQAVPDTRDDLVNQLKAKVESGTYHVPASDIATQLLRRVKADSTQ